MGGSQVSGDKQDPAGSIASSMVFTGTAHLTLNAPGKPGLYLWSLEELEAVMAPTTREAWLALGKERGWLE